MRAPGSQHACAQEQLVLRKSGDGWRTGIEDERIEMKPSRDRQHKREQQAQLQREAARTDGCGVERLWWGCMLGNMRDRFWDRDFAWFGLGQLEWLDGSEGHGGGAHGNGDEARAKGFNEGFKVRETAERRTKNGRANKVFIVETEPCLANPRLQHLLESEGEQCMSAKIKSSAFCHYGLPRSTTDLGVCGVQKETMGFGHVFGAKAEQCIAQGLDCHDR